jgi:hypothetical protein
MTTAEHGAFSFGSEGGQDGLTKREYFAAHAPEIPNWFANKLSPTPKKPKSWMEIKWSNQEETDLIRSWWSDPIFDLPEHLIWYQQEWQEYNELYNEWNRQNIIDRYFQWRIFYADNLINELNKTP